MLARFLREHSDQVWRAAGMAAGPELAAIVPSGQGRPGPHPLLEIVASCVDVPIVPLSTAPSAAARARGLADGVAAGWPTIGGAVAGADVLLVDDTWVSGASAQSAAAALKAAGARRVALVVVGRHVDPADPRSAEFLRTLRSRSS